MYNRKAVDLVDMDSVEHELMKTWSTRKTNCPQVSVMGVEVAVNDEHRRFFAGVWISLIASAGCKRFTEAVLREIILSISLKNFATVSSTVSAPRMHYDENI